MTHSTSFCDKHFKEIMPSWRGKAYPTHATRLQLLNPRSSALDYVHLTVLHVVPRRVNPALCTPNMPSIKPELDPRLQLIGSPFVIMLSVSGRFTSLTRDRSNQTVNVEFSSGTFDYRVRSTSSSAVTERLCAAPFCWKFY